MSTIITNVNKGVDPAGVQQDEPPYFVNWRENGENKYAFYPIVSSMFTAYERLKSRESKLTPDLLPK
jgi:hypothetical protein